MTRIKVINDPPDLITIFRAVDTDVKKKVFKDCGEAWVTADEIRERYGDEGVEALYYFEKTKLVDTKWQVVEGEATPKKAYHTFYTAVHINIQTSLAEISEVMNIALMPQDKYDEIEGKVAEMAGDKGVYVGDVAEKLGLEAVTLKSIVRRSPRLIYRGHRIEPFKGE
ncbi:MAG: ArsR family transcriptional regulator [Thermoplasmata archaeon]|nr:ArsR family transcriptional regulator [Thermoplasmata archaeon]